MRKPDVDAAELRALVTRIFPGTPVAIARTTHGITTQVYRLTSPDGIAYLRVAEDQSDRFGAELLVHEQLLASGVKVPRIVHYEPFDDRLDRSIMITSEIAGRPLDGSDPLDLTSRVLRAAGRDLALINSIHVAGFGFVLRDDPMPQALSAEHDSSPGFVEQTLESDISTLEGIIDRGHVSNLMRQFADRRGRLADQSGRLAHGDFDGTHILQSAGNYSGLIDFGEIRGADRVYDLAHFALHDREHGVPDMLAFVLAGYREITELTVEDEARMWLWSSLIGVRFLAQTRNRLPIDMRQRTVERIETALAAVARET